VQVASSGSSHTSVEVRWPGNGFTLQLQVLPTYPETSHIFLGIDILSMTLGTEKKQLTSALRGAYKTRFGQVVPACSSF